MAELDADMNEDLLGLDQRPLDESDGGDAPRSLYRRILGDIEARILSGQWPPGHRIPYEHELTVEYGCSRMTVNKALTQLARSGLIERRRRSGSFVRRPMSQAAVLEIHDIRSEVEALGMPYRFMVTARERRRAAAADRLRLDLPNPADVLDIVCLHFSGERPFCLEERLISLEAVPAAAVQDFVAQPPGPWLVGRIPWSAAEHRIRAAGADPTVASALDVEEFFPCLVVERRTWNAGHAVTHVRFTYPGDGHALVARFAPAQA